jgi:hypothetical protein
LSFCDGDKTSLNQNRIAAQAGTRIRRLRLVEHLHRLGPAPLAHFIREVEAGANIDATLAEYAELDPSFVRAYGGSEFPPAFHAIDGDGQ